MDIIAAIKTESGLRVAIADGATFELSTPDSIRESIAMYKTELQELYELEGTETYLKLEAAIETLEAELADAVEAEKLLGTVVVADQIADDVVVRLLDLGAKVSLCGCKLFGIEPGEDVAWATNSFGQDYCANSTQELVKITRRANGTNGLTPSEA